MPWVRIPPAQMPHLPLFGYDFLQHGADGWDWYHGPKGRTAIDPNDPKVWVEDAADAMQLGAQAIIISYDNKLGE